MQNIIVTRVERISADAYLGFYKCYLNVKKLMNIYEREDNP